MIDEYFNCHRRKIGMREFLVDVCAQTAEGFLGGSFCWKFCYVPNKLFPPFLGSIRLSFSPKKNPHIGTAPPFFAP